MSYQHSTLPVQPVDQESFIPGDDNSRQESEKPQTPLRKLVNFLPQKQTGYILLSLSALAAGFGNALSPVSILTLVHTYLLLVGCEFVLQDHPIRSYESLWLWLYVIVVQALGFCLGLNGMFAYPKLTAGTIFTSIAFGILLWIIYVILAVIPYFMYVRKYPTSVTGSLVFPVLQTVAGCTILGSGFSTFVALGNANLDYAPLRQLSTLLGIYAVNWVTVWIGTIPAHAQSRYNQLSAADRRRSLEAFAAALVGTLLVTGFLVQSKYLYQTHVSELIADTVPVSCVFSQGAEYESRLYQRLWNATAQRVWQGDGIVLMSEEAMLLKSTAQEDAVIDYAIALAQQTSNPSGLLLGFTYELELPGDDFATNQFVLVSSSSSQPLWRYKKAHPVPVVESNVKAGPAELPTAHSAYGKLSGAICFDLDFPQYIAGAGREAVDLFLQPSWTWNAINSRHFDGDSLRAIENGFTLFRCSSDGESGIVDPYGKFLARKETGHDPDTVATFQLPLYDRVTTFYPFLGFTFEYLLIVSAFLTYVSLVYELRSLWTRDGQ